MEPILISFQSDPSGIQPGVEGLQQLGKVDKDLANTFTQTNNTLKERDKAIAATKTNLSSYTETLTKVQQAATGAFGTKVITDYQKATASALGSVIQQIAKLQEQKKALDASPLKTQDTKLYDVLVQQLSKDLSALYAQLKVTGTITPFKPLTKDIGAAGDAADDAADSIDDVNDSTRRATSSGTSFRAQLRAMQQELSAMEESGRTFSDTYQMTFDELAAAAGQIADQIGDTQERVRALGSDTATLDAVSEAATGIGGAFQFAAGASALLGVNNENLQETLVKLNAIMAITQSLQQAQAFIRGQSILAIKLETIAEGVLNFVRTGSFKAIRQNTAATVENIAVNEAETVALEGTAVAATGASVAMQVLRAALLATGIGAVVIGLIALVSAMSDYVNNTEEAEEAQLKFNRALKEGGEFLDAELSGIQDTNDKVIASMKARNASENEIAKQELSTLVNQQETRKKALVELTNTINDTNTVNKLSNDEYQKLVDKHLEIQNQLTAGETAIIGKQSELQVKYFQDSLKNLQAYAQARSIIASEKPDNLAEQLAANIALAKADATVQLANANLTAGERYKIEVDLQKKVDDLKQQYRIAQLTKEKNNIDAQAALAKEGSEEAFNAHLAQLNVQKEIDLANAKGNNALIAKINSEFYANQAKVIKQYNFEVAQSALQTQKALASVDITNLQRANISEVSDEMIAARKREIEVEASLEVLSIQNSVTNEEERKARIQAVYAKELQDKQNLEKAKLQAEIDNQSNNINNYYQQQSNALNLLSQNFQQFGAARKNLDDAVYKNSIENIVKQRQLLEASLAGGLISVEEYYKRYQELDIQHYDALVAHEQAAYQRRIALEDFVGSTLSQLEQGYFDERIQRIEEERSANEDLLNNKLITQNEYNKRQAALQKQESALKREQALLEIFIEGAKKIFEIQAAAALQTALLNPVGAAIALSQIPFVLVQEGIAAAFVATRKFKKGGYTGDAGENEETGVVHGREFVAHATATKKHRAALEAMNQGYFEQYLQKAILDGTIKLPDLGITVPEMKIPHFDFEVPDIHLTHVSDAMLQRSATSEAIDYKRLANEVADAIVEKQGKLEDLPVNAFTLDENGYRRFLKEKNRETEYVNQYYTTKGTKS